MRTVVIPTDFTNEGIQIAEAIVRDVQDEVRIIFTHLFHVADDIQDLLFSTYREKEYELVSESFWQECRMLKDSYSDKLTSIKIDFFYGNKLALLRNFLDYYETDFIAYSEQYGIPKLTKSSLDALPVLKKTGVTMINADMIRVSSLADMGSLR
ncbi:hypothetical protein GCM10010967_20460 [Dyadobacter beijingensis]|uniref:Universal stress protein family protein n=1 Tax=Dyadobacter beijingensis TaxID=365489 RepID=A0ABQ2HSG9_9BACT|nr:hypothetical protein [Dyadobacter beijingensis]GGM87772.1 hypothetical protein GCM10010967_20460 [Dyadobacter beijingensis]